MKLLNRTRLAENIEARIRGDMQAQKLFGASVIVKQNGDTVYKNHFGTVSCDSHIPVSDKTVYRLASMTKPVTAVAVLILEDRGLLSTDDPIEHYLTSFSEPYVLGENGEKIPVTEKVKISHLLTHTSGVGSGKIFTRTESLLTQKDRENVESYVDFVSRQPLSFVPGTKQEYSPFAAFSILVAIIQKLTGRDVEEFFKREIFEPLGMTDTTFEPSEKQWSRIIAMHNKKDGESKAVKLLEGCIFPPYPTANRLGGAGLVSTLNDYERFADMLLGHGVCNGKRIISEDAYMKMATPQISEKIYPSNRRWGFGTRVITGSSYRIRPVGSFGWSGAFGTHFWVDPENEIVAIYMKNSYYDGGGEAITASNFERDVFASFE